MVFFSPYNQNYLDLINNIRNVIENTYDSLCDVIEYQAVKNEITKRTDHKEVTVQEKKPCRISYKTISNATSSEKESKITQIVKLFIAPEVEIKPGSKIVIVKQDKRFEYKNSGQPALYDTHQEVILENFKGWA